MVAESRLELLDALIGWWAEQGGVANDARSIADWLWLHGSFEGQALPYRFVPAGGLSHATDERARERERVKPDDQPDLSTQADGQATASGEPPQADPFTPSVFPEAPPPAPLGEASAHLLSPSVLPDDGDVRELLQRRQGAVPLLLSQAPLLQRPLRLLGALAPILHKRPHPRRRVLAEERSAERSAELGLPWPVFQPRLQPAVEVRIWLDAGVAMAVWWPLAQELRRVLASSQALARVELHALQLDQLAAENLAGRVSGAASDATPLTVVLSDTAGRHWWDGSMAAWLERIARHQPVAILHTLPIRYQQRTALRRGVAVTLSNRQALGPNLGYRAVSQASLDPRQPKPRQQGPSSGFIPPGPMRDPHPDAMAPWSKAAGLKLPVLTLDPRELAPWAAMVGGEAQARTGGTVLPIGSSLQSLPEAAAQRPADGDAAEAERLWLAFRQQASPEAQRLLQLMAAAPVLTLPVLRLLLAAELPELDLPLPLAEVLVSGLVRPRPGQQDRAPDVVQFELVPALQVLLEAQLEPFQRVKVIRSITALLESRWNRQGHGDSFATLLTDPLAPLPEEAAGFAHIANVTAAMLDRLPGKPFRDLAAQLRNGSGLAPSSPWPPAVAFEELVFEPVQLLEVPGLELVRVESVRFFEQELRRIKFTTAGLHHIEATHPPGAEAEPEYGVVEAEAETWGYHEPLAQIRLTMVQIPAGGFLMGSPPEEPDRDDDEGPQHAVDLESFFISQTPITQAQWCEVAGWEAVEGERWSRELKPNPSRFQSREGKGEARLLAGETSTDNRPVEQVSWHDAMEFCNRLSQRTGRTYRLPSEAQWEYACRAGTSTPFHVGETITTEIANYNGTYTYANGPKGEYRQQTTPVGMFPANVWGLQDMHGNVREWCLDHWHENYEGAPRDGSAWLDAQEGNDKDDSTTRLLRGGSWFGDPGDCRSAYRYRFQPDDAGSSVGFRVVCLPQGPSLNP